MTETQAAMTQDDDGTVQRGTNGESKTDDKVDAVNNSEHLPLQEAAGGDQTAPESSESSQSILQDVPDNLQEGDDTVDSPLQPQRTVDSNENNDFDASSQCDTQAASSIDAANCRESKDTTKNKRIDIHVKHAAISGGASQENSSSIVAAQERDEEGAHQYEISEEETSNLPQSTPSSASTFTTVNADFDCSSNQVINSVVKPEDSHEAIDRNDNQNNSDGNTPENGITDSKEAIANDSSLQEDLKDGAFFGKQDEISSLQGVDSLEALSLPDLGTNTSADSDDADVISLPPGGSSNNDNNFTAKEIEDADSKDFNKEGDAECHSTPQHSLDTANNDTENEWNQDLLTTLEVLGGENDEEEEVLKATAVSLYEDTDENTTNRTASEASSSTDTEALSLNDDNDEEATDVSTDTTISDSDSTTASKPTTMLDELSDDALIVEGPLFDTSCDDVDMQDGMRLMDDHQHQIMPRQPEIIVACSTGISSATAATPEEEKAEVDEYRLEDHDHMAALLPTTRNSPPLIPPEVMPSDITRRIIVDDNALQSVPPIIENNRAEYLSVMVINTEETGTGHGLEFMSLDGQLIISQILPSGLFDNSPLAPFDKVLRINDLNVETLDPRNAAHLLSVLKGGITVIAQNRGGVKDLVESQVTKPDVECPTGIGLEDRCIDEKLMKYGVEVVRVDPKSLFSTALLHPGDQVIAINECSDLCENLANVLLQTSPQSCVILARTKLNTQMAIARRPTHQLPPNFNLVRAMEEAERQLEELRRKQGCYYNTCEKPGACGAIFQWLSNLYVITMLLALVIIGWFNIKEHANGLDAVGVVLVFIGVFFGGIVLGLLVNAPWWYRKVGARFSFAQLIANLLVIMLFIGMWFLLDHADEEVSKKGYQWALIFALLIPLLFFVNLPSIFVRQEDGSDGNTISDRSPSEDVDDLSTDGGFGDIP